MRVIAPASVHAVRPEARRARALNLELAGLLAVSIVVTFGVLIAVSARMARVEGGASAISLANLKSASDLAPALNVFSSATERDVVAAALFRRASSEPRLQHVGALASVSIGADEIRRRPALARLRERLARRGEVTELALLSAADIAAIKPNLVVRNAGEFRVRAARAFTLLLAPFWLAHLVRRWRRRDDDPVLLPVLMLLCGIGLMVMFALRDPLRDTISAETFVTGIAAGLLALVVASEVDFEASRLRRAVLLPLGAALGLALLLLLFGSGPGSSGVKVNLFGAQPVEIIRLLVIFALAAYFGRRIELLRELSEPVAPSRWWLRFVRVPRWKDVRPVLASMALVLLFFFFQKDLGPALVLTCVFLALYGVGRGHVAFVLTGFALLVLAFAAAYVIGQPATVRQRVTIWANPWNNGVPGGNQIAHGFWALSTGGIWGSGPGLGNPELIPAGHTDFVLAAVGEELGFLGIGAVVLLYALLAWRCFRAALRAPGDYSAFLATGIALGLVVQAIVIASGLLGLVPLSGVVTPFLSFGRSSMLANCFAVGIVLAIAQRRGPTRVHMQSSLNALGGVLAVAAVVVGARAAWIQTVRADAIASAPSLSEQADGGYRFEHNPRLLLAARTLPRGTIYDRSGLPLATSRPQEIAALASTYRAAGVTPVQPCDSTQDRCYPLAGITFHVIGDWNHQSNWGARNSSYIERDSDARLKGFDDHARAVEVLNPRTGQRHAAITRDYAELLPLVRQRYWPRSSAIRALEARNRDIHLSIDARLQLRASAVLKQRIEAGGEKHGAAVVLDGTTGEVLASVSYPWPSVRDLDRAGEQPIDDPGAEAPWLDRVRYGLYPPGSVFKLLIAGAALRSDAAGSEFMCERLPDGRVGHTVRGSVRPVRDDPMDTIPHGAVTLSEGLAVSCNAYFAQLAQHLGPRPVLDVASLFQIDVAQPPTIAGLQATLAHAGYGQGQVVVSPLKMAMVSASIASGGSRVPVRWVQARREDRTANRELRFLSSNQAAQLGRMMRSVVTDGTGRAVRSNAVAIAGKTGTAEVGNGAAHSWFTGFAPYGGGGEGRIAFAVLVENAGYGARAAAPVAGELVTAARDLGFIK
jgi:cell division protein FtsW (lipid II flippase)/cell division protein FtsI/penicillin-binding protein 2